MTPGDQLKFPAEINKISENTKNLLRSLLQMEPKDRLDWETFFSHPVFASSPALDSNLAKAVHLLAQNTGKITEVDNEFNYNRNSVTPQERDNILADPMNMESPSINPQGIDETLSTMSGYDGAEPGVDLRQEYKEYSFRYMHEKNKILVMYLTVKKLRQLMKEPDFRPIVNSIYILVLSLAKKGSLLSELTILSLKQGNNIFKLPYFDAFYGGDASKGSEEYHEALQQLEADRKTMNQYHQSIIERRADLQFTAEEETIFNTLMQPGQNQELRTLDEYAKRLYLKVREFGIPPNYVANPDNRKFYLLTMIFTIFSIKSEQYLPYMIEGSKFEWETFKPKHEELNCDALQQKLNNLEKA